MLATGGNLKSYPGSAIKAIQTLIENAVPQDHIIFVNLICCPEGLENVLTAFPKVRIVTAEIDRQLDENKVLLFDLVYCSGSGRFWVQILRN
jgi:uracil phosphoribosyltransferase